MCGMPKERYLPNLSVEDKQKMESTIFSVDLRNEIEKNYEN